MLPVFSYGTKNLREPSLTSIKKHQGVSQLERSIKGSASLKKKRISYISLKSTNLVDKVIINDTILSYEKY